MSRKAINDSGDQFEAIYPGVCQTVSYNASVQSSAFGVGVTIVRLVSTIPCWVKFGADPTAANTDMYLPAGIPEYFAVKGGDKVAAYAGSAGVLYVTEGN